MGAKSPFNYRISIKRPSHILGIFAIFAGCWWFYIFRLRSLSQIFTIGFFTHDLLFLFFFTIMMFPGIMTLYNGIGLLREVTKRRIKGSTGSLCIIAAFLTLSYIDRLLFSDSFGKEFAILYILAATIVIIPFYILISRKIILSEKMEIKGKREFVGKGILTLVAWEIWLALSELVRAFAPVKEGEKYIKEAPWNILGIIGPILIAWVFYRIASSVLKIKDVEQGIKDNTASHGSTL